MWKLVINEIEGIGVADIGDCIKIEVFCDYGLVESLEKDFKGSQIVAINGEYLFRNQGSLRISYKNHDSFDAIYHMDLGPWPALRQSNSFKSPCGEYKIVYSTIETNPEIVAKRSMAGDQLKTLTLHSIRCNRTEDSSGNDDLRLKIYIDGCLRDTMVEKMTNGKTWKLDNSYVFNEYSWILLEELDDNITDDDDYLGLIQIRKKNYNNKTVILKYRSSRYGVRYSIS